MADHPINAQTRLIGVIGWPVRHSLSPAMHNAVLAHLGLNMRYLAFEVSPEKLPAALAGLAALGIRGCNFTVPHKVDVLRWLQAHPQGDVHTDALALGAVNTVVIESDEETCVRGYNTDVKGYIGSLEMTGIDLQNKRAVVVGAGGAARGVIYGLLKAGVAEIALLNRTMERARALADDLSALPVTKGRLTTWKLSDESLISLTRQADLLVNATTVGMLPDVNHSIWTTDAPIPGRLLVSDLVYNPLETKLLRDARRAGAATVDGLGMLARQGALALDLWTEEALDVEAVSALMRKVCETQLSH